jgi:archaellum component FlaC
MRLINEAISSSKPLLDLCELKEPDYVERAAAALLLHSFYNGIENVLLIISKNIENELPNGIKWHKELLDRSFEETDTRKNIFRKENKEILNDYLSFRHFIRHSYGFQIKWEKMKDLVKELGDIWEMVKEDMDVFIENNAQSP